MRGKRTKIQITASGLADLTFVDIYIPLVDNPDDPPEVIIYHHKNYLHLSFPTRHTPSIIRKGMPTWYKSLDDKVFSNYDLMDFWDLNDSELE